MREFSSGWFNEGLTDRSITRDIDWGIPVPLEGAAGKVLYVWFDAPIGYISSTVEWAQQLGTPERWKNYWCDPNTRLIHFIGKDNIVFHAIVWPAMLMAHGDYILPDNVPANEFLTIEGQKLSTSRNWAVWVDDYLEVFPPDPLRYYLAANAPETKDADFAWKDFQTRNNSELADVLGNLVNRTLSFVERQFEGKVPPAGSTRPGGCRDSRRDGRGARPAYRKVTGRISGTARGRRIDGSGPRRKQILQRRGALVLGQDRPGALCDYAQHGITTPGRARPPDGALSAVLGRKAAQNAEYARQSPLG